MELIYEETISPNKEYVEKEEDIVNYTVEVYQDDDHMILSMPILILQVFNRYNMKLKLVRILQRRYRYRMDNNHGNPTQQKEDLLAIAYVSISEDGSD